MDVSLIVLSLNILIFILGVAIFTRAMPYRRQSEFFWLLAVAASLCVISFCSMNVYVQTALEKKMLFSRMRFLGLSILPAAWFLFILAAFRPLEKSKFKWLSVFVMIPVSVTLLFTVVPAWQDFVVMNFQAVQIHGVNLTSFQNGPWFPIHMGTSTLWAVLSLILTSVLARRSVGEKRKQLIVLTAGGAISLGLDLYFVLLNSPYRWFMFSSATLAISELSIFYAIIRYGLLDVARIGKDQIFNKMADPIFILDREDRLLDFNRSAEVFFELKSADRFKNWSMLRSGLSLEGKTNSFEWTMSPAEQMERSFVVTLTPLSVDNEVAGRIVTLREFTEQKMIENNLSNNLELKSKLLSLIAHDFSGFVQAQTVLSSDLEKKVQPGLRSNAEALTESVSASKEFMENVMRWAELQTSGFQPVICPFEIVTLVKETIQSQQPMLVIKGMEVVVTTDLESVVIEGDSVMLGSAIRNVLNNAIRASVDKSKIYISISTAADSVEIKIRDEGHGMDMSGAEISSDIPSGGFGIGLTLAKKFVSLHDGSLVIESQMNSGTTVSLSLPF